MKTFSLILLLTFGSAIVCNLAYRVAEGPVVLCENGWSSGADYRSFDWSGYDEDDFPVEVRIQIQADRARLATLDAKGGR